VEPPEEDKDGLGEGESALGAAEGGLDGVGGVGGQGEEAAAEEGGEA